MEGTEILLESTANGIGGEFHERWQMAERGQSDYIAIFVPWFWQEEYTRIVDHSFELTEEEREYQHLYGLTAGQMAWRRAKISELKDPTLFKQEYPATAAEAFQASGHDSYITPDQVNKARKNTVDPLGPLVIGADPARFGDDRFALAFRQGRKLIKIESREKLDVVQGANWIKQVIDAEKPERVFIDVGGLGAGTYDILASWGGVYRKVCVPINFGSAPQDDVVTLPDGTKRGRGQRTAALKCGCARKNGWMMLRALISLIAIHFTPTHAGRVTSTTPTSVLSLSARKTCANAAFGRRMNGTLWR
jgi:hypothetical protein